MAEGLGICFFGTYVTGEGYPVNRVLIKGLKDSGGVVSECREELWQGFLHQVFSGARPGAWPRLALRALGVYPRLIYRYLRSESHRVVIVGYPGYADIVLARLLNPFGRRLLVLVSFISLYDTVVLDRGQIAKDSWKAKLLYGIDRLAFRAADLVLVDTGEVADYFARVFALAPQKFHRSMVGNVFDGFEPSGIQEKLHCPLKVLFFGTYVPLHGIEYIIEAAELLREEEFEFSLVGSGQLYDSVRQEVDERKLQRVDFVDEWISSEGLAERIRAADVCLGIFGTTPKASRVIPYKIFAALALRRPVITRDSPAVRELLADGESALFCTAGSGAALAQALRRLRDEGGLAARLAQAGYESYRQSGSVAAIGRDLMQTLEVHSGH